MHYDVRPARSLRARPVAAAVTAGVLVAVSGCTGDFVNRAGSASANATASPSATATASPSVSSSGRAPTPRAGGATDRIPEIIRAVEPSVVTIFTAQGLGSGVIYRPDGTIITNDHVVSGQEQVQVAFADGRRVPGRVIAADPGTDLAIVKVERGDLPAAKFQTQLPQVGDLALALGSPLGFEGTATAGIISGLSREIPGSAQSSTALVNLIQTDAPISPGNSGGALVNAAGEVVGINDAYIPPAAGAVALGFAIPSATVVDVVEQLLKTGEVRSPFVGIRPGGITPELAQQLGLPRTDGVLVLDVVAGSPAAEAGLLPGDVVTSLNGQRVRSVEDFLGGLRVLRPEQQVPVVRLRDGKEETVQVTLGEVTRSGSTAPRRPAPRGE